MCHEGKIIRDRVDVCSKETGWALGAALEEMKSVTITLFGALALSLCSCTIYLKDLIHGPPDEPSYDKSYRNALAEGLSPKEAHQRALFAGGEINNQTKQRRKREKKEKKELDRKFGRKSDSRLIDIDWD